MNYIVVVVLKSLPEPTRLSEIAYHTSLQHFNTLDCKYWTTTEVPRELDPDRKIKLEDGNILLIVEENDG